MVLKITPNFSSALTQPRMRREGIPVVRVSFWEQRNAAVVVRVLEEEKKNRRKEEKKKNNEIRLFFFSLGRVLPRSRYFSAFSKVRVPYGRALECAHRSIMVLVP